MFTFWSPEHPVTEVVVFVEEPFPFDEAYDRALCAELAATKVMVASIADLIELKRRAARPKDIEDVYALEAIARELHNG